MPSRPQTNGDDMRLGRALSAGHASALPVGTTRQQAVALARGVAPTAPLVVRVPALPAAWLIEEASALIIAAAGVAMAPSEDAAGLLDAAAAAIHAAGVKTVLLLEADALLAEIGEAQLARWIESTENAVFLLGTGAQPALALPPSLDRDDLSLLAALTVVPTRVPVRFLESAALAAGATRRLERLRRMGLLDYEAGSVELAIDLPEAVRVAMRAEHADLLATIQAPFLGSIAKLLADMGRNGHRTIGDRTFAARHRALIRAAHAWCSKNHDPHTGEVALALVNAMSVAGGLSTVLQIAEEALASDLAPATRLGLEARRAILMKGMGRTSAAALLAACKSASSVPARVAADAAQALAVVVTPEIDQPGALEHIARTAEGLAADPATRALGARLRATATWMQTNAEEAFLSALEHMALLDGADSELEQLDALIRVTIYSAGLGEPDLARDFASSLEAQARRVERAEWVARAQGARGCSTLDTAEPMAAVADFTAAIDALAARGFRHHERWHRFHRGIAFALGGEFARASLDFDDFVAMTSMMQLSPALGHLANAMVGSTAARAALGNGETLPAIFRPLLRALDDAQPSTIADDAAAPGFYAVELRGLKRLLGRERVAAAPQKGQTILVGPGDAWFEPLGGERVLLSRMPTMRRVFSALATAHERAQPLSVDEIFALGWPGDRVARTSATNRVYVTITRLRGLGLGELLVYVDGGWLLAPSTELRRSVV